ncbi:MAG: response regulator [Fuerstiella sp.]
MIARYDFSDVNASMVVLPDLLQNSSFRYTRNTDDTVRGIRILIIDDEPVVVSVVRKYLRDAGCDSAQARQTDG